MIRFALATVDFTLVYIELNFQKESEHVIVLKLMLGEPYTHLWATIGQSNVKCILDNNPESTILYDLGLPTKIRSVEWVIVHLTLWSECYVISLWFTVYRFVLIFSVHSESNLLSLKSGTLDGGV